MYISIARGELAVKQGTSSLPSLDLLERLRAQVATEWRLGGNDTAYALNVLRLCMLEGHVYVRQGRLTAAAGAFDLANSWPAHLTTSTHNDPDVRRWVALSYLNAGILEALMENYDEAARLLRTYAIPPLVVTCQSGERCMLEWLVLARTYRAHAEIYSNSRKAAQQVAQQAWNDVLDVAALCDKPTFTRLTTWLRHIAYGHDSTIPGSGWYGSNFRSQTAGPDIADLYKYEGYMPPTA